MLFKLPYTKYKKGCQMLLPLRKRKINKSDKQCITRTFSQKVILDIDFTNEPVVQCNVKICR